MHGSIETSSCRHCRASFGLDEVDALFTPRALPSAPACDGPVKPDVVLFGELLPEAAMAQAQELAGGPT